MEAGISKGPWPLWPCLPLPRSASAAGLTIRRWMARNRRWTACRPSFWPGNRPGQERGVFRRPHPLVLAVIAQRPSPVTSPRGPKRQAAPLGPGSPPWPWQAAFPTPPRRNQGHVGPRSIVAGHPGLQRQAGTGRALWPCRPGAPRRRPVIAGGICFSVDKDMFGNSIYFCVLLVLLNYCYTVFFIVPT
jgi:hypothetical protein